MSEIVSSSPYGIKAIRQIKAHNTTSLTPTQTIKLAKKKEQVYAFFLEKVDPIIGECITSLLIEQPTNVPKAMIQFLQKKKITPDANFQEEDIPTLKPKRDMKLFLANYISPIVSKLVNRVAVKLPNDVIDFMCQEITGMMTEDALLPNPEDLDKPLSAKDTTQSTRGGKGGEATSEEGEMKTIQIAVLGLGNAGKSSIINALQGKFDPRIRPTTGFRPVTLALNPQTTIKLYDLGGGKKIRDIWDQYYHDVHGIIYVIDATEDIPITDNTTIASGESSETIRIFQQTLDHENLKGKPLLIFANKQDLPTAKPATYWQELLPIPFDYQDKLFIAESSSFVPENIDNFTADPNLEGAIELLIETILQEYSTLQQRVEYDIKQKAKADAKKRIERERKVLKSKIAQAFFDSLAPEIITTLNIEADPSNIFGVEEGLTFIAHEIGEEIETLPEIAKQIAALVGYQRLAMQIVGALKSPINKNKVPMTWTEIMALVYELRDELGLS
jgi:ADP-ribosylation factor-like protein 13B